MKGGRAVAGSSVLPTRSTAHTLYVIIVILPQQLNLSTAVRLIVTEDSRVLRTPQEFCSTN